MLQSVYSGLGGSFWGKTGCSVGPHNNAGKAVNFDGPKTYAQQAPQKFSKKLRAVPSPSNVIDFVSAHRNSLKGAF